jgi:hypothetical protein
VPAAAVIPAPLAYTIIVAVKRLVVGLNANKKKIYFLFHAYNICFFKCLCTLARTFSFELKTKHCNLFLPA